MSLGLYLYTNLIYKIIYFSDILPPGHSPPINGKAVSLNLMQHGLKQVSTEPIVNWSYTCQYTRAKLIVFLKQGNLITPVAQFRFPCNPSNNIGNCCSASVPCREGEGGCNHDWECTGHLVCGRNNCYGGAIWMDCCERSSGIFMSIWILASGLIIEYF